VQKENKISPVPAFHQIRVHQNDPFCHGFHAPTNPLVLNFSYTDLCPKCKNQQQALQNINHLVTVISIALQSHRKIAPPLA
jgi:hypothetical protein